LRRFRKTPFPICRDSNITIRRCQDIKIAEVLSRLFTIKKLDTTLKYEQIHESQLITLPNQELYSFVALLK
jgi:hypothetical protein